MMERVEYLPFYDLQHSFVLSPTSLSQPQVKRTSAISRCLDVTGPIVIESLRSDKLFNSTTNVFRSQHVIQHVTTPRRPVTHTKSVPLAAAAPADDELPSIVGTMRPESGWSRDTAGSTDSATPRSSDVRQRPRRIDLDLPPRSTPPSRLAAADSGAGGTQSSAADSSCAARPTRSRSLARRTAAAAVPDVQEVTSSSVDDRARLGDVMRRVGWSHNSRHNRVEEVVNSVDSEASRDSNDDVEDIRPAAMPGRLPLSRSTASGLARQARPAMTPRQLTLVPQRRPTTTRPSTTPKTARMTSALPMSKSASQPSFLAMLVSGTAVPGRGVSGGAGPTRGFASGWTTNTRRADENGQTAGGTSDERLTQDDDDDEDDEMKRQRIEDWLHDLETVALERPPSPVIDEDAPPQTDTAIHIVYDGD